MSSKNKEVAVSGGDIFWPPSLAPLIGDRLENGAKRKWPRKRISSPLNGFSTEHSGFTHRIPLKYRGEFCEQHSCVDARKRVVLAADELSATPYSIAMRFIVL